MLKNGYRWITYHSCKHECLTITQATDSERRVNCILAALGNGVCLNLHILTGLRENSQSSTYVHLAKGCVVFANNHLAEGCVVAITQATDSECGVNYILAALGNGFDSVDYMHHKNQYQDFLN